MMHMTIHWDMKVQDWTNEGPFVQRLYNFTQNKQKIIEHNAL